MRRGAGVLGLFCALFGVLFWTGLAAAQGPPCFRSKFARDWPVHLQHVELQDSHQLSSRDRAAIVHELKRQCDCWPCALSDEVGEQIREMYQWYGYFQAVADVDIQKLGIDSYSITARVQEGPQYRLKDLEFAHIHAFPDSQLRSLFAIAPGALYDTRKVREGLEALRHQYSTAGYVNFSAVPEPVADAATQTIELRIDADEGVVFKLGPLLLAGIDPKRGFARKLLEQWKPHLGEAFNSDFVDDFLAQNLSALDGPAPHITYVQDAKESTVAVKVEFPAKPAP